MKKKRLWAIAVLMMKFEQRELKEKLMCDEKANTQQSVKWN